MNISALSLVFIIILFMSGTYSGMFNQIEYNMVEYEVAGGQYWLAGYDKHDPFKIDSLFADAKAFLPEIEKKTAVPLLFRSGALYTEKGMRAVLIKGIDRAQTLLNVPTKVLNGDEDGLLSAYVGNIMAEQAKIKKGDIMFLRFRDKYGVNIAVEISIDSIMHTPLQSIDVGQIWVDLEHLRSLCDMQDMASMMVVKGELDREIEGWDYQGMDVMFTDLNTWKAQELTGAYFLAFIMLGLAVLTIFDTQILSIFKRKKEIGTLVALGMRRIDVIGLFTIEGLFIGVFSIVCGSAVGIPMLMYFNKNGIKLSSMEDFGMNIMSTLYPELAWNVVLAVIIAIMVIVTLVSLIASRRISKMNIVQILKGK